MFRKILGAVGILLLAALVMFNFQGSSDAKSKKLKGSILVAGSTSVQPFTELLAEEFHTKNPGVRIDVQGGGSGAGIKSAQSGAADIGASSRELKAEEKKGLNEVEIALDGISVIVNPKNKVKNLSLDQIKKIFSGEIKNWKEVGGINKEIVVVNREEGSGTRGAFEEIVLGKAKFTKNAIVQGSTGAVEQTVAGAANAIGYVSLAQVNPKEVKPLTVDGVEANEKTIQGKKYKIARPFLFLTKGKPAGVVKAFIDFALSKEGQNILAKEGLVKVK